MTSQKFQLTTEYKRKQKNLWRFLAFFVPVFTITTTCYSEGEKLTWQFFWIIAITILAIIIISAFILYFVALRKTPKYWIELEFRENDFIISATDYRQILYSDITKVIFYKSRRDKLFYTKIVLPKKSQYILGFEKEQELIGILEDKIKEYNIKKIIKTRYINLASFYVKTMIFILAQVVAAIFYHFIYN